MSVEGIWTALGKHLESTWITLIGHFRAVEAFLYTDYAGYSIFLLGDFAFWFLGSWNLDLRFGVLDFGP